MERGLLPDFSRDALAELDNKKSPSMPAQVALRDMRDLLWCSIDNDDSRDLDQLTVAEPLPDGRVKIFVAIADVDSLVQKGSAIDSHARHNTASVYTPAEVFPMLPEKLSTDLTSLNLGQDRVAIVVEMVAGQNGETAESNVYGALVRNHAKLAYNSVAAWLDGVGPMPEGIASNGGLEENLGIQDKAAQTMKTLRHSRGALTLETIEARPVFEAEELKDLEAEKKNRAKDIIEDFMIAANSVTSAYLASKKFPSLRRVVREPKRWDRIVELASEHGFKLPPDPDSAALEQFLVKQKEADPVHFTDLSLSVIKLIGEGEYVALLPGETEVGHFGLAVRNYAHSTAPNRRYPDLITQRLLKAAIYGSAAPYEKDELNELAAHCTEEENVIKKVERQVQKSAAAMLLAPRVGEQFDSIVTGASPKGTWVRLLRFPIEGRVVEGFKGADVGHRMRVQLIHTDIERGFIDFKKVH